MYDAKVGLQLRPPKLCVVIPELARIELPLVHHSAGAQGGHVEPGAVCVLRKLFMTSKNLAPSFGILCVAIFRNLKALLPTCCNKDRNVCLQLVAYLLLLTCILGCKENLGNYRLRVFCNFPQAGVVGGHLPPAENAQADGVSDLLKLGLAGILLLHIKEHQPCGILASLWQYNILFLSRIKVMSDKILKKLTCHT